MYVHGQELPFKIEKVKLICSWTGTAVQKKKKPETFGGRQ